MDNRIDLRSIQLAAILSVVAAASQGAAAPSAAPAVANAPGWIANGASACEKYLTPAVVSAILLTPAEHAQRIDASSCHAGVIYINLEVANIDVFRLELPRIFGVHLMGGVGDGAYWNQAGAVAAVKGHDRGCNISVIVPQQAKIHDAALGQALGAICNQLFALP